MWTELDYSVIRSIFAPLMNCISLSHTYSLKCVDLFICVSLSAQVMLPSFSNTTHYVNFNNFAINNVAVICLMLLWELTHQTADCQMFFTAEKSLKMDFNLKHPQWIKFMFAVVIYYTAIHLHFGVKALFDEVFSVQETFDTPQESVMQFSFLRCSSTQFQNILSRHCLLLQIQSIKPTLQ